MDALCAVPLREDESSGKDSHWRMIGEVELNAPSGDWG